MSLIQLVFIIVLLYHNVSNDFNVKERENEGEGTIESIKESDDDYTNNLNIVVSSYFSPQLKKKISLVRTEL